MSAIKVEMSSYSATNSLLRDKVDTDPAKDAENRVSKTEAKLIKEDTTDNEHNINCT